ncbi:hypothetical protein OPKNFCMD_4809 [Methylobacterium crusticola]|uniref:Class I SAM-dependent methyltransferase n=1 Tax=Methylobacterium crusticola TaxID=1697972 RepID=A0ABQ4R341_9HYPH|nr:hypothetical protein [Methylobacterium crusticola]GJD52047.1 hypothetical protein OPKNFCMD_4809 [Methylobacterium crusticola]
MRHAVIFSSFVPETEVALSLSKYYLDLLETYHKDSDIYLGINTGSGPTWRKMLRDSTLKLNIAEVDPKLHVNSDVSGFQAALDLLRQSHHRYDYYWFGHTKGVSHSADAQLTSLLDELERNFWSKRLYVEEHCSPEVYGVFGSHFMPASNSHSDISEFLKSVYPSPFKHIGYITTYTFFGLTSGALDPFLERADDLFFNQNLINHSGLSRYFFEGGFSWISDFVGLEPFFTAEYKSKNPSATLGLCHPMLLADNQEKVRSLIEAWRQDKADFAYTGWPVGVGSTVHYDGNIYELPEFIEQFPHLTITLDDIGLCLASDRASSSHNFLVKYEKIFAPFREQDINILHIGTRPKESLRMWTYFFRSANIIAVDEEGTPELLGERIRIEIGDQGDAAFMSAIARRYQPKIVIDDGSHISNKQISSLQTLLPLIGHGGLYVVEDLHTCVDRLRQFYTRDSEMTILDYLLKMLRYYSPENDSDRHQDDEFVNFCAKNVYNIGFFNKMAVIELNPA